MLTILAGIGLVLLTLAILFMAAVLVEFFHGGHYKAPPPRPPKQEAGRKLASSYSMTVRPIGDDER